MGITQQNRSIVQTNKSDILTLIITQDSLLSPIPTACIQKSGFYQLENTSEISFSTFNYTPMKIFVLYMKKYICKH